MRTDPASTASPGGVVTLLEVVKYPAAAASAWLCPRSPSQCDALALLHISHNKSD